MDQYYILTQDLHYVHVIQFIRANALACSVHLNRTRFTVPEGPINTLFQLEFAHCCPRVDASLDLITGLPKPLYG